MNVDWVTQQLDYVYFSYGVFLMTLFLICFSLHTLEKDRPQKPAWLLFGLFGLTYGIHEWLEMLSTLGFEGEISSALELLLMVLAFLALMEFGRRGTPRLAGARATAALYGALLLLALSGLAYGLNGFKASARYSLALPGGLLAARAFFQEIRKRPPNERPPFLLLSLTVALLALSIGSVVPTSGFARGGISNSESFLRLMGFPVQLLKGLLALSISLLLGWYSVMSSRLGRRSLFGISLALTMLTTIGGGWYLTEYGGRQAARELENDSLADVTSLVTHINDTLRNTDMAALNLADSPALAGALASGKTAELDQANALLDQHQVNMGLAVCYLMDGKGLTIASSNRTARDSFVGKSYAFRPYFTETLAGRQGRYFALGITSGERGYYTGSSVLDENWNILGVVVAKRNLNVLAKSFTKHPQQFLVSPEGVIFISGSRDYLFRTLWPLAAAERAALKASKQFGEVSFTPLLEREPFNNEYLGQAGHLGYVVRLPISAPGWSVILLHSTASIAVARLQGIGMSFMGGVLLFAAFLVLLSSENSLQGSLKLLELRRKNEIVLAEQLLLSQFISGVSQILQSPQAMVSVLQKEAEIIVDVLDAAFARVWVLNPVTNLLELRASAGLYTHLDGDHARIPVGQGMIGLIAQTGKPLFTNAISGNPGVLDQEWARREGMQAFAGYPLRVEGRGIGVLGMFARQPISRANGEALGVAADLIAAYIDRKRAEDSLRESEFLLKESQIIASLGSYVLDVAGGGTWQSSAMLDKVFGIDETYNRTIEGWVALLHPEDRPGVEGYMRNEVLDQGRHFDRTYRIIRCDSGATRWVQGLGRLEFDAQGRPVKMHGTIQDVTERKRVEDALQQKTRQLEKLTQNLEQEVATEIASRSRNEQLLVQQSKMAAMGEMLGAIAHQWRQPLNTLGMCVQNIGDVCAQGDIDRPYRAYRVVTDNR